MSATLHSSLSLTSWLPLQNAAGALRDECSSLEQMVQDLFADLDRLSAELEAKADEVEEGRRHLAERGRQLAEQRKESARLSHQLEQQETQLSEALAELRELRGELADRPEPAQGPDLSTELADLRGFLAKQFAEHQQRLEAFQPASTAAAGLESLQEELLQQHQAQLQTALAELREMRAEFATRSAASPSDASEIAALRQQAADLHVERAVLLERLEAAQQASSDPMAAPLVSDLSADSLRSLSEQFSQQLAEFQQQIQASQPDSTFAADLEQLQKNLSEQHADQFAAALAEFREMRTELTLRADAQPAQDSESAALRQQVFELEVEQAVLRERCEAAAKQTGRDEPLVLPIETFAPLTGQFAEQFSALQAQIQALQKDQPEVEELDSLRSERLELEAELELVRAHSACLQETVAFQKRELASQRVSVSEELQELRSLISEQTRLLAERGPAPSSVPVQTAQPRTDKDPSPDLMLDDTCSKHLDPVVNSVMAQFAKLQKDISQRRKKK